MAGASTDGVRCGTMSVAITPPSRPHARPAEGEISEILGYGRVLWFMRIVGVLAVATQAPMATLLHPAILLAAMAIEGTTIVLQPRLMRDNLPLRVVRRRAVLGLTGDIAAVYLVGTAFAADPGWVGFYFYPLVALEATLVAGAWPGVWVTIMSVGIYLAQLVLRERLGYTEDLRAIAGAVALLGLTGGVLSAFGAVAERGRRDLRVLLDLTAALANQRDEKVTIERLDRRLDEAVGGRVRSVALRRDDGSYEILRWHAAARRTLPRQALERVLGDVDALESGFTAGASVTYEVEPDGGLAQGLGLPDFTRAVTLVPIFAEGAWVGILPVLWPTSHVPNRNQLRLLYGLSGQVGMALAQGELHRIREQAATDPLTGLANRRAILDDLEAAIARARRRGGRVSVLFCDLDAFKAVNDRDGHAAGDRVLRRVAASIRGVIREGDAVGRYGGDELLVVAHDADGGEAARCARRIGAAVRLAAGEEGVDVTVGIATYPTDGDTAADLVAAADQAMYRGKLRGPGSVITGRTSGAGRPVTASA
jgi:diguanylate cyclase (GGDEF)-like protein